MAKIHPRVGFHTSGSGGNPSGIGENYVHRLHDAGIPVTIACADGFVGIGDALQKPHPDDVLIYRVVRTADEKFAVPNYSLSEAEAAESYWHLISPHIPKEVNENKDKIWVAYGNELDQDRADWVHGWSVEMAKLLNGKGYKALGPNWAAGTPRYEAWDSAAGLAFLRYCAENPGKAAVGIHEYSYDRNDLLRDAGNHVGRYRHILKVCHENNIARPTILIKEFGYENRRVPGPSQIVEDLGQLYERYPDYPPAALWWLGAGAHFGKIADLLQKAIKPVGEFVASHTYEVDVSRPIVVGPEPGGEEKKVTTDPADKEEKAKSDKVNVRGIELDFFEVQVAESSFQIHQRIWCNFRYHNRAGADVQYGGLGIAVHRWTGQEWKFHYYQHSYTGRLRPEGGPGPGGHAWRDNWKADDVATFALTPFLTFDSEARKKDKRKNPASIADGYLMGRPVYVSVGSNIEPGKVLDSPPAPLFPELEAEPDTKPAEPAETEPDVEPTVKPTTTTTTETTTPGELGKHLWAEGISKQLMSLNPSSSLQGAIFGDGYAPTSPEFRTSHEGNQYACQLAENLGTGERRVYYIQVPQWKEVKFVTAAIQAEAPFDGGEPFSVVVAEPGTAPTEAPKPAAPGEEVEPGPFKFEVWPTVEKRINQKFGERPDFYKQFGLPGHEGIDLAAPFGTPYMCVAPGKVIKVSDKRWNGQPSAYGWHVVVEHRDGYTTLYAHAKPEIPVKESQEVAAGQVLAFSGNTGNSSGPHLHLTVKKEGYQLPGWGPGYMDPYDLLRPLYETVEPPAGNLVEGYLWSRSFDIRDGQLAVAKLNLNMREKPDKNSHLIGVVKTGTTIRILDTEKLGGGYMYCEASIEGAAPVVQPTGEKIDLLHYIAGDGRVYEVKNEWGSQERFQTQWDGTKFFQTKNQNWEEFFYDNDFIYRDVDTSPGAGRFYRVKDADRKTASRWVRRHMAVGESYTQARRVQFYKIENCAESAANSGNVKDTIKLVAHHKSFECKTGFKLNDVVELLWVNGGEKYFYAKNYGLVAWERTHDDPNTPGWSGIAEEHARGARPDNPKLAIGCL